MPNLTSIQSQLRQHEQWLIGLRRDSSKTLRQIKDELFEQKGITVSENQLEIYFKKSGQRKNLAQSEWKTVFHFLDSQKAFGCVYDLYISEKLVLENTLRRNRRRTGNLHPRASSLREANELLTKLPEGVTVKLRLPRASPGPSLQHRINWQPVLEAGSTTNSGREPSVLHGSISADSAILEPSASIPGVDATSSSIGSLSAIIGIPSPYQGQLVDFSATTEAHDILQDIDFSMMHEIGRGAEFDFVNTSVADYCAREFPLFNFPLNLQPHDLANQDVSMMGLLMPAEREYGNQTSVTPMECAQLLLREFGSGISRRGPHGMHKQLPTTEELLSNLESLVSIEDTWEFHEPLHVVGGNVLFPDQFVQLFLFAAVNNFAGIDTIPMKLIMRFMNQHKPLWSRILSCLTKGESAISSRALTENLLKAAIDVGDVKTVHDLLALKVVKPDDIICMEGKRRRTPLERASTMRHFEIMELLLRFGADVNKTYVKTEYRGYRKEAGALECAIRVWGDYDPIDIKIVDLLLDHGATVCDRLVQAAIRWGDARLIEKLMPRFLPSRHEYFFSTFMLIEAAGYLKNDIGLKIVQQAVRTCRDMHDSICLSSNQQLLVIAMMRAANKKNTELVCLLLPHGGQNGLDAALTAAVRSGSHSLVHLLIKHGACADCEIRSLRGYVPGKSPLTTPLAEAIRADDAELIELLAKEGAWNQIGKYRRLEAALRAVAESGSLVYLDKVLQLVPRPELRALTSPLHAAIVAGHEEVALRLIGVGADVNDGATGNPLLESLQKKSQSIFWAILESDVQVPVGALELAVAWGDQQIIKALVFMGADINTCEYEGQLPLVTAIRAGDRPLIDLLISLGAALNSPEGEMTPLVAAVLVQDEEIVSYLLDHGADPADETAFLDAATHNRGLLNLVFQAFGKQYPKGRKGFGGSVLHHALNTQDDELLKLCLNTRFDVNTFAHDEKYGDVSTLGLAIKKYGGRRLELVCKLLDAGGDANIPASERADRFPFRASPLHVTLQTALLDAIETKSLQLVQLLISKGATVQMEAKWGLKRTPLQKACEVSSHTIVDVLLANGADVNEAPAVREGATALQLAAKAGSARIAKTLLAAGADVNAPRRAG